MWPTLQPYRRGQRLTAAGLNRIQQAIAESNRATPVPRGTSGYVGMIVTTGPRGEPDFCAPDPRYWVRQVVLSTGQVTLPENCDPEPPLPSALYPGASIGGEVARVSRGRAGVINLQGSAVMLPRSAYSASPEAASAGGPPPSAGPWPDPSLYQLTAEWRFLCPVNSGLLWLPAISLSEIEDQARELLPGTIVVVFPIEDDRAGVHMAFTQGAGGTGHKDVRLNLAIQTMADAAGDPAIEADFAAHGQHLSCWEIDREGAMVLSPPLVVFPNWDHTVAEFKTPTGNQLFDPEKDPPASRPAWTAHRTGRGWELTLGEGQEWVEQPEDSCLCAPGECSDDGGGGEQMGACCRPNGSCVSLTEDACNEQFGAYQGDASSCIDVDCIDTTGACCLPGGTCTIVGPAQCTSLGGVFQGAGTQCASANCAGNPVGACCFPGGGCSIVTQATCQQFNGDYQGNGTTCASCEPPGGTLCCYPGGICLPVGGAMTCQQGGGTVVTSCAECTGPGGGGPPDSEAPMTPEMPGTPNAPRRRNFFRRIVDFIRV